jgi:hypothetical protein
MDELSPVFEALRKEYSGQRWDMKDPAILGPLMARLGFRSDANESIMFARELEYVFTKTYDVLYPDLKARSLLPVNREVPAGADQYTYTQYDRVGEASEVDDYAKDFPTVEVKGDQKSNFIVSLGDSYQYTIQDMRAAAMAKKPLDAMKAAAARRAMEEKLEKIAALGSSARGITGALNAPNVDTVSLTNGAWKTTYDSASTFDDMDAAVNKIQADVKQIVNTIRSNSLGIHGNSGLRMTLDLPTYLFLTSTPQSPRYKENSIKDFLLKTVEGLSEVTFWNRCTTGDGSNGPILWMYEPNPDHLELVIPQEFEQFPPQLEGMATKIYCHMRCGGVQVRRPKAMKYATNHA